jgi:predicted phosphodiesterase
MPSSTISGTVRKWLRSLLKRPVTYIANRVSSAPDKESVMKALSDLYQQATDHRGKKVNHLSFSAEEIRVIIFSDQHRGARDGQDDFGACEPCYLAALEYYNREQFYYINLGDCEELWENTIFSVVKHNRPEFEAEKKFIDRNAYCKLFGNHDLFWDNDPLAATWLKKIYGKAIGIFAGIVLHITASTGNSFDIFCTHGHQGDKQSDGNAFSKWFVSYVWGPLQSFLGININSSSANDQLKTLHNMYMYDWSATRNDVILITGHTHQPVFKSLTHLERLYLALEAARRSGDAASIQKIEAEIPRRRREYDFINHSFQNMKPGYFNSGCCCFDDGTITGIEIREGFIRLVKWSLCEGRPVRIVAEEERLQVIAAQIKTGRVMA